MLPKYKDIADLVKKGATVEAQEKIMELREGALELQEENLNLKSKVTFLENALLEKNSLIYEAPFYWKIIEGKKDGPFCQKCNDSTNKHIRLQDNENDYWVCLQCDKGYCGPNHKEPDLNEIINDNGWP